MISRKITDKFEKHFADGSQCDIISSVFMSTYSEEETEAFEFARNFNMSTKLSATLDRIKVKNDAEIPVPDVDEPRRIAMPGS